MNLCGTLPSGGGFHFHTDGTRVLTLHAEGKACAVHPKWMTRDEMVALRDSLTALLDRWDGR